MNHTHLEPIDQFHIVPVLINLNYQHLLKNLLVIDLHEYPINLHIYFLTMEEY